MTETLHSAFQGIWSHKLRSFLTMLGVIIGIAAIIGIVSTIQGTNEQIMQNLIGAGNNNVTVSLKQGNEEYYMDMGAPAGITPVSDEQREEIYALEGVVDASFYLNRTWGENVTRGDKSLDSAAMRGVDTHYLSTTGYLVYEGRPFIDSDFTGFRKVALLDEVAADKLFPDGDAVGGTFDIKSEPFVVVGLIRKADGSGPVIQSFQDYINYSGSDYGQVLVPSSIWPVIYSYDEPEYCVARARSVDDMSDVGRAIETIMNRSVLSGVQAGLPGEAAEEDGEESEEEGASDSSSSKVQIGRAHV